MVDTKKRINRATPHNPQTARIAVRGHTKIVERVALPHADISSGIDHENESPEPESNCEEVVLVRRKGCKPCVILSNCPLGRYDDDGYLLNRLDEPSVLGLDHVFDQSLKHEILDASSQGKIWISTGLIWDIYFKIPPPD
uniref:Uncharacterized protein n=1 Tax=Cannabis sativa TaxID=3483 RepID=A0A803PK39_CANSA